MAGKKRSKIKDAANALFSPPSSAADVPEDDNLLDELMAQIDQTSDASKQAGAKLLNDVALNDQAESQKKGSKNRFKAREARKAAELAASYAPVDTSNDERLSQEAKAEEASILSTCQKLNLEISECPPDGHCMFHAIADQLNVLGLLPTNLVDPMVTRKAAAQYMSTHPDDFIPFLPSVEGEDGAGATEGGIMTPEQFKKYCQTIAETAAWGGQPEILALSKAYGVEIDVVQGGEQAIVKTKPFEGQPPTLKRIPVAFISYHRRMYGLGEHYNSLRPRLGI